MKVYLIVEDKKIIAYSHDYIEGTIEVEVENPREIQLCVDTYEDGVIIKKPTPKADLNRQRIIELKNKLAATDYYCLKFVDGELTEEEYLPIKVQRQAYRDEINALEKE